MLTSQRPAGELEQPTGVLVEHALGVGTGRQAEQDAVELFHADLMDAAYDEGDDPVRVTARVMGESWAYHQLAVHDYSAMATFIDEFVDGELAVHASLARSWVGVPMGGYRIERPTSPYALVVRDLADGRVTEVLDLGARCLAGANGAVIGRLVPSGTTPAFDVRHGASAARGAARH